MNGWQHRHDKSWKTDASSMEHFGPPPASTSHLNAPGQGIWQPWQPPALYASPFLDPFVIPPVTQTGGPPYPQPSYTTSHPPVILHQSTPRLQSPQVLEDPSLLPTPTQSRRPQVVLTQQDRTTQYYFPHGCHGAQSPPAQLSSSHLASTQVRSQPSEFLPYADPPQRESHPNELPSKEPSDYQTEPPSEMSNRGLSHASRQELLSDSFQDRRLSSEHSELPSVGLLSNSIPNFSTGSVAEHRQHEKFTSPPKIDRASNMVSAEESTIAMSSANNFNNDVDEEDEFELLLRTPAPEIQNSSTTRYPVSTTEIPTSPFLTSSVLSKGSISSLPLSPPPPFAAPQAAYTEHRDDFFLAVEALSAERASCLMASDDPDLIMSGVPHQLLQECDLPIHQSAHSGVDGLLQDERSWSEDYLRSHSRLYPPGSHRELPNNEQMMDPTRPLLISNDLIDPSTTPESCSSLMPAAMAHCSPMVAVISTDDQEPSSQASAHVMDPSLHSPSVSNEPSADPPQWSLDSAVTASKQMKETAFYSGAHPALKAQRRHVLPPVSAPLISSAAEHLVHQIMSSEPPQRQPGHSTGVTMGLQGRAFVFDSDGQPLDVAVVLAAARSTSERSSSGAALTEGLRECHGPLVDVPMDHIMRLLDFYIDRSYHQLIETNGQNKDVLLWTLIKRIGMSSKPPPSLNTNEVLAFLSDCVLFSDQIGLVKDHLPPLRSDLPSCLPSLSSTQIDTDIPPPSTAWADCCRRLCGGQAVEAVEFAMEFGMWGHALSIALLISVECFNAVRAEYAASLNSFGQPRKSQYWVKNASPPPNEPFERLQVDCVKMLLFLHALPPSIREEDVVEAEQKLREMLQSVDDLASTWLARVRVNVTFLGLGHPNCRLWLRALGKELLSRNELVVGQCCLLLSGMLPGRDFVLLGCPLGVESFSMLPESSQAFIDFDWEHFQMSEFFERILAKWSPHAHLTSLDIPRFLYGRLLRFSGHHQVVSREHLLLIMLAQADRYFSRISAPPNSSLAKALEVEAPSVTKKHEGHKFGISSLLRTFLSPDE